jgi:tripartite-type tricarboxylate transporter receptor subunit TctC
VPADITADMVRTCVCAFAGCNLGPVQVGGFMRHAFITALAVCALAASGSMAVAQTYPAKPIRLIAPEVVGSATDLLARIIAPSLSEQLGQPVEIENLFGEAGIVKGIKSAPDGYTLIYGSSGTLALLPHIRKVAFDSRKDVTAVGQFVISPTLLAVNPSLPVRNVQEFVAYAKANPDKLRMSTAGAGTAGHFAGEMFIAMTGIKAPVVHYPGGGPAIDAVVSNDAQWTMAPIAGRLPHVRTGKLRALATGSPQRLSMLPDVPTVAESGYPGYSAVGWGGIFVPNGTPQAIVDKLNAAIAKAVALPDVRAKFEQQGTEGASSTQAELTKMLREDYVHLGDTAKSIGIGVD